MYQINEVNEAKFWTFFYVNVADSIGKDYDFEPQYHPSLSKISEQNYAKDSFDFKPTDQDWLKKTDKFYIEEATGAETISSKLLKLGKPSLTAPITELFYYM